ncbi:MAG: carbon starvation protein A [Armatimonadota bacterium]
MNLLTIVLLSAVILGLAYRIYGSVLARLLKLDPQAVTPAEELRDDVDYEPIEPKFLFGQHFSAIAAAGPIVGPILAGVMFGWLPALLWILVGSIFLGGVHDITALVASIRHKARSIAEVVREHMTRRSYLLFLGFIWIALVYIVVAFTDVTAAQFVGTVTLEDGRKVAGGGIATSSLIYLMLPMVMGLLLRFTKLSLGWATAIFLPLVGLSIYVGPMLPLDLGEALGLSTSDAQKTWDLILLGYCFVASLIPMWLLLQPRGHLGGYFLYLALGGAAIGLLFGGQTIQYPAFTGWETPRGELLFPILFITIACGACSGFHSIIASGTTSKQLKRETDAKVIGYGTMLLEGLVAVVSLCCVMRLAQGDPVLQNGQPNYIYARGMGSFLEVIGINPIFAVSFGLMAFTTFVYDTLDVCTRLGRYLLQELFNWHDKRGRWVATALTAAAPLLFIMRTSVDVTALQFAPAHVKNPSAFTAVLRDGTDPVSTHLRSQLSPEGRASLGAGDAVQPALLQDLNRIIAGASLYEASRFSGVKLSGDTEKLARTNPTGDFGVLLNRSLIQETYAEHLTQARGIIPVWRTFWNLFGASNQLLAALTLLGVTVWLWRTRREKWVWAVTGIPTVFMYCMSVWALGSMTLKHFYRPDGFRVSSDPVAWVGLVLIGLALLMLVEAFRVFNIKPKPPLNPEPVPATG